MMKFSIVKTDKKQSQHLSVKPAEWFFERIKTDTKADDIRRLREFIAEHGDTGGYEQRNPIAWVYPQAELKRSDNGRLDVAAFNGVVNLHVGGLMRADDIEAVKSAARILPMTLAAFVGADGRSVEVLVAVGRKALSIPETETEADRFLLGAYDVAFKTYSGILPKAIERQKATCRSCFRMPLDTQPYVNSGATALLIDEDSTPALQPATDLYAESNGQRTTDLLLYADYERMYERAAEAAYNETAGIIEGQRHEAYITELARRLCMMNVPEEEAFLHLRNHHVYKHTYNEDTFRAIVAAVYAENTAQLHDDADSISRETQRMIQFLTTRYVFRYNTVMGYTEFRPNNTWIQDWQPCDENAVNGLTIEARLADLDVRDKDVRRYVRSNMIRPCNPLEEYILNVQGKWDGQTDHIAQLARCVPCDIPQWETWFKKWFLAMVAQWILPPQEYGNSIVPLLISRQGDGKTTFCRHLLPKELRWGFHENLVVDEKRQTLQAMHNFLLINLDEFNAISPKQQEGFLKNIIQLPSVKIKRPYGRHVEEFKRYASFIATTNETRVLSDATGSRRFICVHLTGPVNTTYQPNYEGLYAQAYQLIVHHKEQWWFDAKETAEIMEHNRQYQLIPPAILYFNEYFEAATDEACGQWLSPTAIYQQLRRKVGSGLTAIGVVVFGRQLSHQPGLRQRRLRDGRQYLVRERK